MKIEISGTGLLVVRPGTDTDRLLDIILASGYNEEYCVAFNFSPAFIAELMYSSFLVMSSNGFYDEEQSADAAEKGEEILCGYILLSKHHLQRNVLFFDGLHIRKTAARLIKKEGWNFELRVDDCYDEVVERCVAKQGADWLTPPLLDAIRQIRADASAPVRPCSFALFHNGELCAGEFGVKVGSVYTSYSGYMTKLRREPSRWS